MIVRAAPFATALFLIISICPAVIATDWYVDGSVGASGNGQTWETAFKGVQEGIDAASDGETVIVAEGTYPENIQFNGKNISLTSTDPLDSDVVANTIINGNEAGSAVTFSGEEGESCVLSGFTLQNGFYSWGGGIFGNASRATIQNNVIRDNRATQGGALAYCDGVIRNNVIAGNNAVQEGGGLYRCHGEVENNTIVGNSAERGGGLYGYEGTIRNCIIWGNVGQVDEQVSDIVSPMYCCIQNWERGGEGNISWFPYFMDLAQGDSHLQSWSPCIDAGDRSSDFFKEPEPNGRRINMGAYGNTPEATFACEDEDQDLLPDSWEFHFFDGLAQGPTDDTDADGVANLEEYRLGSDPTTCIWYVDGSVSASGSGRSWQEAFKTIQEGIDAARDTDTIILAQGTYAENIHFQGKSITLTSTDAFDPSVVANTIIDGSNAGSVVTFSGDENETCVFLGFTVQNGKADYGGGLCGGTSDNRTRATIRNNIITGNSAVAYEGRGGGLAYCEGTLQNNVITGNSAWSGGGLSDCDGLIEDNTISDNSAIGISEVGGGDGGGLLGCGGTIRNNVITGNSAWWGGGLRGCHGTIENNTIYGNSAYFGGSLDGCDGTIRNCIIWGNPAKYGPQPPASSEPTHCCIERWFGEGEGNITLNPHFVDPSNGDFRVRSWSPCIDSGDISSDFSKEPQPNGMRVNLGAYGNTPDAASKSPDTDADTLPDDWELHCFGHLEHEADADPDRDRIPNIAEYRHAWDPTAAVRTPVQNVTKGQWWPTIQDALWESDDGDEIVVHQGVYHERIGFGGRNVVLRSTDPSDPGLVANTIIDGDGAGPVVTFSGTEDETCVLSGFTITNGTGGISSAGARATIRNNVITRNSGTGLSDCDGTIKNNTISYNDGGGLYGCNGAIQNNVITGNSAWSGGGLSDCDGLIENNTISDNSAIGIPEGGGGYGGGLLGCGGTIRNCIIWRNTAPQGAQLHDSGRPSYCCIQDWTGGLKTNIRGHPQFVDAESADFRLLASSPCIDAGFNHPELPATDIAEMHRIMFGGEGLIVDMGAYEFHIWPPSLDSQTGEVGLKWSGLTGETYSVYRSGDMLTWELAADSLPSMGDTFTTWLDPTTLFPSPEVRLRFYRIIENE